MQLYFMWTTLLRDSIRRYCTLTAMTVDADKWAELQTRLSMVTGSSEDWGTISQALRELQTELQRDIDAKTAQCDALELDFVRETTRLKQSDDVDATIPLVQAHMMEDEWIPDIDLAQAHFHEVMRLVQPATERLELLDARTKYFEAAIQVETRSRHVRDLAEQASTDALNAFAQLSLFVQGLPKNYSVIHVSGHVVACCQSLP